MTRTGIGRTLVAASAALAALVVAGTTASAADAATASQQTVSYRGYQFTVPKSWPVIDLANSPHTCVDFSRHALYLGAPSDTQDCSARARGKTAALLVGPGPANAPVRTHVDSVGHEVSATAPGITVTGGYGPDFGQVSSILSSAGLSTSSASPLATANAVQPQTAAQPSSATTFTGEAFDACDAPSLTTMNAWKANSPYSAIGIYIGGVNRGCSQANLTASWVSTLANAGWHFYLMYVGPQDPDVSSGCVSCSTFSASTASSAAVSSAQDAASEASALGFGTGTPIFYDMEAYSSGGTSAALTFASSWTTKLHSLGYLAGEYSSGASGIADLVNNLGSETLPDMVDVAHWNGQATASDSYVPSGDFANHQRIHQYAGNATPSYGGYSISGGIDEDYMDVSTKPSLADGTFVNVIETGQVYRIAGGAPIYVSSWANVGGSQPYTNITQAQLNALPQVPADGTALEGYNGGVYIVAGGAPIHVHSFSDVPDIHARVIVDQSAIDDAGSGGVYNHLSATPADGTALLGDGSGGGVYIVAGGAPIHVHSFADVPDISPNRVLVDQWSLTNAGSTAEDTHLRATPADGTTLLGDGSGGGVYIVAGGAPIHVHSFADVPDISPNRVYVDQWSLTNAGSTAEDTHLRATPADGTALLGDGPGGGVYIVAGGAPIHVHSFSDVPHISANRVTVDQWTLTNAGSTAEDTHLRATPADGTALLGDGPGGGVYIVAGGAPIYVSSFSNVPDIGPRTYVDEWTLDNAGTTAEDTHLSMYPADNTMLRGETTGNIYQIESGYPTQVTGYTGTSVGVDQNAITNAGTGAGYNHLR
ncbi:DUF1906 domain-containing protein [Actinospica robiniae]|uniref:DUF1906 domain-containing protein n=1 Tax=Actinospica robiniae TaxID=304901 RepID=UPI0003FD4B9C|nr:DUF1906 domain-containing protein [Actinospica robiniae]